MNKRLVMVDDEPAVLDSLRRLIHLRRPTWEVTCVDRCSAAWARLLDDDYDALVVDIWMPGMSGLELLERVRRAERTQSLPVLVLTGLQHQRLRQRAQELGASDLVNKPVDADQLLATLDRLLAACDQLDGAPAVARPGTDHEARVRARLEQVCRLARLADTAHEEGENHAVRVGCCSGALAEQLGLGRELQERLLLAAPLHDVGKSCIPVELLRKPGPLDAAERGMMQRHCVLGERMLRDPQQTPHADLGRGLRAYRDPEEDPILPTAATIALAHHERWDGAGYPRGLAGQKIPLEARIVAICEVFDALLSRRPYRKAYTEEEALRVIDGGCDTQFDPVVHRAFHESLDEIRAIRAEFAEGVIAFPDAKGESL